MLEDLLGRVLATGYTSPRRRVLIVGVAFAVMFAVGFVDNMTGNVAEWSVVYAACVAVIAWYGGMAPGLIAAALSAAMSLATAIVGGGPAAVGEMLAALPIGFVLGLFAATLAFLHDVLRRTSDLARTDPLTGAVNTRAFDESAEAELAMLRRYGVVFSLAFFDMDDFKQVNDRFGHAAGDALLRMFVETMDRQTRVNDVVARVGGDEFVLLMPHTDSEAARVVLTKLRGEVETSMREYAWDADVSAGTVTFESAPDSVDDVLRIADRAMYDAKAAGKGRTEFRVFSGTALESTAAACAGPAPAEPSSLAAAGS